MLSRTRTLAAKACILMLEGAAGWGCVGQVSDGAATTNDAATNEAAPQPTNTHLDDPSMVGAAYIPEQTVRFDLPVPDTQEPTLPLCDLAITQVAAFQAVKATLWRDGEIVQGDPRLVAGKSALLRVFVSPGPRWPNGVARAKLTLTEPGGSIRVFELEKLMAGASTDNDGSSTFNFSVASNELTAHTHYRVDLDLGPQCKHIEASRRVPREGPLPLDAVEVPSLKVVLVPFIYNADNSGRLPVITPTTLETLRSTIVAMFPVRALDISVRQPVPTSVSLTNESFALLLDQVRSLRATDQPASDVHYLGLVAPSDSLETFCSGNCTAGLAFGNVTDDPGLRVGVSLGFEGPLALRAIVHELGHTLGLRHAPCNTSDALDPNFPHAKGLVGVWGFDERTRALQNPSVATDFMGYCQDPWISDYSFSRIQTRLRGFSAAGAALTSAIFTKEAFTSVLLTSQGRALISQTHLPGLRVGVPTHMATWTSDAGRVEPLSAYRLPVEDTASALWLVPSWVLARAGWLHLPGANLRLPLPR